MRRKVTTAYHRPNRSWFAAGVQEGRQFSTRASASRPIIVDRVPTQHERRDNISPRTLEIETRTRYKLCEPQSLKGRAPFASSPCTTRGMRETTQEKGATACAGRAAREAAAQPPHEAAPLHPSSFAVAGRGDAGDGEGRAGAPPAVPASPGETRCLQSAMRSWRCSARP